MNKEQHIIALRNYAGNITQTNVQMSLQANFSECFCMPLLNYMPNISILVFLPHKFPNLPPFIYLNGINFNIMGSIYFKEIFELNSSFIKPSVLPIWNVKSSLDSYMNGVIYIIYEVYKKEMLYIQSLNQKQQQVIYPNPQIPNQSSHHKKSNSQGQISQVQGQSIIGSNIPNHSLDNHAQSFSKKLDINNNSNNNNMSDDQFKQVISNDLKNRSLEELLLINNNVDNYVDALLVQHDEQNLKLIDEIETKKGKFFL